MITIRGKRTNNRRYPGVKGNRPDRAKVRKEEATKRQIAYIALPKDEKIRRNPKKYASASQSQAAHDKK